MVKTRSQVLRCARWLGVVVAVSFAALLCYLRFWAVPTRDLPAAINQQPREFQIVFTPSDGNTPLVAHRARLDHIVNPLPGFHRLLVFTGTLTSPLLDGDVYLRFDDPHSGDVAIAYRCTPQGHLASKGILDVSP